MTTSFSSAGLPARLAFPSADGALRKGIDREKLDLILMQRDLAASTVQAALSLARETREIADAAYVQATVRANKLGRFMIAEHGLAGLVKLPADELAQGGLSLPLLRQTLHERARFAELQTRSGRAHVEWARANQLAAACEAYAAERT